MADIDTTNEIKNTAQLNKLLEEKDNLLKQITVKYADISVEQKLQIDDIQKRIDLEMSAQKQRIEQINLLTTETELLKKQIENEKDKNIQKSLLQEQIKKEIELEKLIFKEHVARGDLTEGELENHKEYLKSLDQQLEKEKKSVDLKEKAKVAWSGITSLANQFTGNLTTNLFSLMSWQGVLGNIGNMFKEVVETNEKLVKTTGQVGLMTADMATQMAQFGVGYADMGEAFANLYTEMTSFSNINKETQKDITRNAAVMNNLGVSTSTTAKNYDLLNKSLKFNASELTGINDKIAKSAIGAGIAPAKMATDFNAIMPRLAASGKQSVDIFIQLEKQSKALGIEISSLVGIVGDGFDTFEGAAEKAGRLNAILGGDYLNSVEMLNATEEERVQILRKSFEETGKSFDSLDRFEQKAIASAMGLKDVTEAQKMFGKMSIEGRIALEAEAASQDQLIKAQESAASTAKQLQLIYNELLIAIKPLAEWFKTAVVFMAENSRAFSILFGAIAAYTVLAPVVTFIGSLVTALGSLGSVAKVTAPAIGNGMGQAVGNFGRSAASAIPTILAFGAAIALIGVGIGAAAYGLGYLAESFAKLNKEQIDGVTTAIGGLLGVLGIMAVLIIAAGAAGTVGAVGMLAFGAAVLLVGGGIAVMSIGMAKLVDSISSLNASGMAGNGLTAMKESLIDIIDLISEMPDEVKFTTKLNQLQTLGQTIKTASESAPALSTAKEFVVAAKEYHVAQRDSKDADNDSLVQALKAAVTSQASTTTKSTPSGTPVILRIENGPDLRAYVLGAKAGIL